MEVGPDVEPTRDGGAGEGLELGGDPAQLAPDALGDLVRAPAAAVGDAELGGEVAASPRVEQVDQVAEGGDVLPGDRVGRCGDGAVRALEAVLDGQRVQVAAPLGPRDPLELRLQRGALGALLVELAPQRGGLRGGRLGPGGGARLVLELLHVRPHARRKPRAPDRHRRGAREQQQAEPEGARGDPREEAADGREAAGDREAGEDRRVGPRPVQAPLRIAA